MNVEKLHVIASALRADLKETNAESNLEQLQNALSNQLNQPAQPQFQNQVAQTMQNLLSGLNVAPSNHFSPTWRQVMSEIGAETLFGRALAGRIEGVFARNQITPAVARTEIQNMLTEVRSFREALDWLLNAFKRLSIGSEELNPGECEIGILIPRSNVDNKLDKFADELEELDRILGDFSELATGSRPGYQVKSVSTTDFGLSLLTDPVTLASFAVAVERIIAVYKNLLEIRELRNKLKKEGVGDKQLEGVEEHARGLMEKGIEAIKNDLFKTYYKQKDDGRENELRTAIGFALRKIANRIDRGVNIEVRALPPAVEEEKEASAKTDEEQLGHFGVINDAGGKIEFIKRSGNPILSLPENTSGKPEKK